ncbi:MAG: HNH endonuclease [Lachnospiraceae bacterium]|nr:HNH endonuclease [Lachnospiraceae bacterium]
MVVDKDTVRKLRLESNRPSFKRKLIQTLGTICANCGSKINIEYHHIVPITVGGTNRLTNFVPLCHNCHELIHGVRNIRTIRGTINYGRKRKAPPENYIEVLDKYLDGQIGKKDCEKLLGLTGTQKLNDKSWFKEYLKERNIVEYKNRIDMLNAEKCKRKDHTGEFVSKITFSDGTQKIKYIQ